MFGWWMLSGINQSNRELEQESRNSGNSSSEYQDIHAFLSATRGCFEAFEIYPQNFFGNIWVVRDRMVLAKEGLNLISSKYTANYPETTLRPLSAGIRELEDAISSMEKLSLSTSRNKMALLQVAGKSLSKMLVRVLPNISTHWNPMRNSECGNQSRHWRQKLWP